MEERGTRDVLVPYPCHPVVLQCKLRCLASVYSKVMEISAVLLRKDFILLIYRELKKAVLGLVNGDYYRCRDDDVD